VCAGRAEVKVRVTRTPCVTRPTQEVIVVMRSWLPLQLL